MRGAHSNAGKRRRFLRVSLGALLLLMIPVGIGSLWLRDRLGRMPIDWKPFSTNTLTDYLNRGQPVLVHFGADWDLTSAVQRQTVLETDAVRRAIRWNNVAVLEADYTNSSPLIQAALRSIDVSTVPAVAVYNPSSPEAPVVLTGVVSREAIVDALQAATVRRKTRAYKY